MGIKLFDRSQKQLSLTPEGHIFLNRIELALRSINDAVLEVNDYKQLQKGTIKIGIPSMIGAYLFPKIFSSFQHLYPHLDIYLYEEGSMAIREKLERDELDFGIVIISDASASLQLLPMSRNQIMACIPEKHPLAAHQSISINDIANADLIMLKEGSFLRQLVLSKIKRANIAPEIVLESNQIETVKGLIASNVGIAFLLDFIAKGAPGIKAVPFDEPLYVDLGLAWKKDRYISNAAQSFIDCCRTTMQNG